MYKPSKEMKYTNIPYCHIDFPTMNSEKNNIFKPSIGALAGADTDIWPGGAGNFFFMHPL